MYLIIGRKRYYCKNALIQKIGVRNSQGCLFKELLSFVVI